MYVVSLGFINSMSKMIFDSSLTYVFGKNSYNTNVDSISSAKNTIMTASKEELQEQVNQLIASHTVVIFSKTNCPYCKMAKQVFDNLHKKYMAIELNERDDGDEIQTILGEITGARTVPRVFVNGVCLGGGTDVKKLYNSGELEKKF